MKILSLILLTVLMGLTGCGGAAPTPSGLAMISFQFDDGFVTGYNSLPIFEKAGIHVTEYIITGRMHGEDGPDFVTANQVLDMEKRGHEVAAHTRTHPHLPTLTKDQQMEEIQGSKQDLEGLLGHTVEDFAYPFGEYNDDSVTDVQAAQFTSARSAHHGLNDIHADPFKLYAYSLVSDTTIDDFKSLVDQAQSQQAWLIVFIHHVDEDPSIIYTVQSSFLQEAVAYVQEKKIQTVTTSEGLHLYGLK